MLLLLLVSQLKNHITVAQLARPTVTNYVSAPALLDRGHEFRIGFGVRAKQDNGGFACAYFPTNKVTIAERATEHPANVDLLLVGQIPGIANMQAAGQLRRRSQVGRNAFCDFTGVLADLVVEVRFR